MSDEQEPKDAEQRFRSQDIPAGRFRPHGKFDSVIDDSRIIRTVSAGPYNEEMSLLADQGRRKLFATFADGKPFAVITEVRESAMSSAATIDTTERLMKAMRDDGVPMPCAVVWIIADGVEGKAMLTPYFERCFSNAGIAFRVMDDMESANQWVAQAMLKAAAP
jgi:hypothetical protein